MVKSLARALDVLTAVASQPRRSFEDLMAATRIPRSSLYRFLSTLEDRGFVRFDAATSEYLPGSVLYQLAAIENGFDHLRQALRGEMVRLVDRIGESAYLYVRVGADRVCIEAVESQRQPIRHIVTPGSRFPLYAGASGRVILAFLPKRDRARLEAATLKKFGPGTLTSRRMLQRELQRVRDQGYAYSEEELSPGAWALAVPVHGTGGTSVASVAIAGPLFRFDRDQIATYVRHLRRVVGDIPPGNVAGAGRLDRKSGREHRHAKEARWLGSVQRG